MKDIEKLLKTLGTSYALPLDFKREDTWADIEIGLRRLRLILRSRDNRDTSAHVLPRVDSNDNKTDNDTCIDNTMLPTINVNNNLANDNIIDTEIIAQKRKPILPFEGKDSGFPDASPDDALEERMSNLITECKTTMKQEAGKLRGDKSYKDNLKLVANVIHTCKSSNKVLVGTDKSKRLLLVDRDEYIKWGYKWLEDPLTYKRLEKTATMCTLRKVTEFFKRANLHIFSKNDRLKMINTSPTGANFALLIKDHKAKVDGIYPVRPIASVHGTAIDGLDWLISSIMTQGLKMVDAHLDSCDLFVDIVNDYNYNNDFNNNIKEIFFEQNKELIEWFDMTPILFREALAIISLNYEIWFHDRKYLQIKGVPMGARFAPPFAIIFMHHIESTALNLLPVEMKPYIYLRYIDDIFYACNEKGHSNHILNMFNTVDNNIKFTIETVTNTCKLPFLDTQLYVDDNGYIKHSWYMKKVHSGNMLNFSSHLPMSCKKAFAIERFVTIFKRTNCNDLLKDHIIFMYTLLRRNDYPHYFIRQSFVQAVHKYNQRMKTREIVRTPFNAPGDTYLKLPFISDRCNSIIKQHVEKSQLPVKFINQRSRQLGFAKRLHPIHECYLVNGNCRMCSGQYILIPENNIKIKCTTQHVIYKITCITCREFYIGKSNRFLGARMNEHFRAIRTKVEDSPLLVHMNEAEHAFKDKLEDNFIITVVKPRGYDN
jgi:hypothetical protein